MKPRFASEDEYLFAKQLQELGIPYKEQVPFVIDEGFVRSNGKKYQDSVYTPDFVFTVPTECNIMCWNKNNDDSFVYYCIGEHAKPKVYVIEIKGWSLYDNPFKYRIAEKTFIKLGYEFHKLKLSGSTKDNTLGFYNYSSGKSAKANKTTDGKRGLLRLFFYKSGILQANGGEMPLMPLKKADKSIYEDTYSKKTNKLLKKGVYSLAEEEWYKEHLDDSEMTNEFLEEFIENNFIIIGKGKTIEKWKFIEKENNG